VSRSHRPARNNVQTHQRNGNDKPHHIKATFEAFQAVLAGCSRGTGQREALGKKLTEETLDLAITGVSAIVIDNASTDEERAKVSDFADEIANMNGERIVAIAVVSN
jgi:hypothetical protein